MKRRTFREGEFSFCLDLAKLSATTLTDARTASRRAVPAFMPLLGAPQEVAEEGRQRAWCPLETRSAKSRSAVAPLIFSRK